MTVDINKKNSEDIQTNAPRLHCQYKQWQISPCFIFYDTQINQHIQNDSNEGYVIVEFKLRMNWPW